MAKKQLATFDIETEPFKKGRVPKPFCCGFYTENYYKEFWSGNCILDFYNWLKLEEQPYVIYAHNGGKFDFYYLFWLGIIDKIKLINGRIVKANIGIHELRDSYAIIPVPLKAYEKDVIDYNKFEKDVRENHKPEILRYLKHDCKYLYNLVNNYRNRFGDNLTIGGTAIKEVRARHPFENRNENHDRVFRKYYFGGRVEFFESGIINDSFKSFDVNSMYPFVMSEFNHPTGKEYISTTNLEEAFKHDFFFINFSGYSDGALPTRGDEGLCFGKHYSEFHTTNHELRVAIDNNLIDIDKIHEILIPLKTIKFNLFVNHFMKDKIAAKETGDKATELFVKLILNSAYGKFGQNPENFYDYIIRYPDDELPDLDRFELYGDAGYIEIWRTPAPKPTYYDVATAASITSAARTVLLDALSKSTRPIYCDTDSIICKSLDGVEKHKSKLGAWDLEADFDKIAIAGKKLYAGFKDGECVKKANKGCKISASDILEICDGKIITWENDAPSFSVTNLPKFIKRDIKKRF